MHIAYVKRNVSSTQWLTLGNTAPVVLNACTWLFVFCLCFSLDEAAVRYDFVYCAREKNARLSSPLTFFTKGVVCYILNKKTKASANLQKTTTYRTAAKAFSCMQSHTMCFFFFILSLFRLASKDLWRNGVDAMGGFNGRDSKIEPLWFSRILPWFLFGMGGFWGEN